MDAVEQMDLSALYVGYRSDGWGAAAFEPGMMTALRLYAYCHGERSSRKIEARQAEEAATGRMKRGRAVDRRRGRTLEPFGGQIKAARGCDGFMRRGHAVARSEWRLICATQNLLKLFRSGKAEWN